MPLTSSIPLPHLSQLQSHQDLLPEPGGVLTPLRPGLLPDCIANGGHVEFRIRPQAVNSPGDHGIHGQAGLLHQPLDKINPHLIDIEREGKLRYRLGLRLEPGLRGCPSLQSVHEIRILQALTQNKVSIGD